MYGRPKHIYSIYRKMQRKQLDFSQLFDVRAVRVVVGSIPECYAALGIVHGQWPYVPGEFDDYIATPKGNGYRSIHTAVIGPQAKSLEVQIRTREMHEHAELGVAAHWTYKEGGPRDAQYQRKIEWVRRLLEPAGGGRADADRDLIEGMRTELFEDRVYVLTPKGEVVDLPHGATPLDFAYSVHTSLGHRCRGAKANGRIVPLTHQLSERRDRRDHHRQAGCPEPRLARARAGLPGLAAQPQPRCGPGSASRTPATTAAPGAPSPNASWRASAPAPSTLSALAQELKARDTEQLYQLLGEGELTVTPAAAGGRAAVRTGAAAGGAPATAPPALPAGAPPRWRSRAWVTCRSRWRAAAHRCARSRSPATSPSGAASPCTAVTAPSLARMAALKPDRVLKVEWTSADTQGMNVVIAISAYDRRGLLRDLSDVLAVERLSIDAATTRTDHDTGLAHFALTVAVRDLEQLAARAAPAGRGPQRDRGAPPALSAARVLSAIDRVDRALVRGEGGLVHRFRERRVRVDGALQVLGARRVLHRQHRLGDQLAGERPDDVHAQDLIVIAGGDDLGKPGRPAPWRAPGRWRGRGTRPPCRHGRSPSPAPRSVPPRRSPGRCRSPRGSPCSWSRRSRPAMRSATMTPSSLPLCASIGPRTQSPIAQTPSTPVRQVSSTLMKPRSSSCDAAVGGEQVLGVGAAADRHHDAVDGQLLLALGVRRSVTCTASSLASRR